MEMSDKIEKIQRFLSVCDELVEGSYMVAEGKISEALKEIAGCRELTNLFAAVTDGYDYPAAKRAYLRPRTGVGASGRVGAYLPSERQDILAFVFCLFVEIDAGTIYLNDLLLRYFYVDGSYTASYAVFAGRMIKPFRDIVRECFPECGKRGQVAIQRKKREEALSAFAQSLPVERNRVMSRDLREEEKTAPLLEAFLRNFRPRRRGATLQRSAPCLQGTAISCAISARKGKRAPRCLRSRRSCKEGSHGTCGTDGQKELYLSRKDPQSPL